VRERESITQVVKRWGPKAMALKYGQLNCQTVNFVLTSLKNFSIPPSVENVCTAETARGWGKGVGGSTT